MDLTLLLFLHIFKLFDSSEIVIPFYSRLSEIPKNQTPQEFIYSLTYNELYTKVKIGTPPQVFDFLIDFENYNTFVIKCESVEKKYPRFIDNNSSTFEKLGGKIYFSANEFTMAENSSDIVTIGETLNNFNYTFLHAKNIKIDYKTKYPGIIGLNVVPNQYIFHYESGLVHQLKSKNMIKNYLFTLSFNENDFNGNIIIGKNIYEDYPKENFTSDYCLITRDYNYYWGWHYLTSYLNSEILNITDISIRPELGVIMLNICYKDFFKKKFFEEKLNEGKCHEISIKYNYYYCDKDVNIDIGELNFEIKRSGLKFSLNSKDLFIEYNNKLYFLIVFGIYVDKKEAKLGYPFLKKYDIIFNIDNRHLGFYNFKIKYEYKKESEIENGKNENNNCEENKKQIQTDESNNNEKNEGKIENNENNRNYNFDTTKIIFIILIVFLILIVIYVIFTIFRKYERKRKGKLYDELFL